MAEGVAGAIQESITALLRAYSPLVALLPTDPNFVDTGGTPLPAMYCATESETPPLYPKLTYRTRSSSLIHGFRQMDARHLFLDVEVWTDQRDSGIVSQIAARAYDALNGVELNLQTYDPRCASRTIYLITSADDCVDKDTHLRYGLYTYILVTERANLAL